MKFIGVFLLIGTAAAYYNPPESNPPPMYHPPAHHYVPAHHPPTNNYAPVKPATYSKPMNAYAPSHNNFVPINSFVQQIRGSQQNDYQFQTGNGIQQQESTHAGGNVHGGLIKSGSVAYTSPEGVPISLTWVADENGFHPRGSHLPTSPPMPADIAATMHMHSGHHSAYNHHYQGYHSKPYAAQSSYQHHAYKPTAPIPTYQPSPAPAPTQAPQPTTTATEAPQTTEAPTEAPATTQAPPAEPSTAPPATYYHAPPASSYHHAPPPANYQTSPQGYYHHHVPTVHVNYQSDYPTYAAPMPYHQAPAHTYNHPAPAYGKPHC